MDRVCQPYAPLLHNPQLPVPSRTVPEEDAKGNFRVMHPPRITKTTFCIHTSNRLFSEAFISGTLGIDFG